MDHIYQATAGMSLSQTASRRAASRWSRRRSRSPGALRRRRRCGRRRWRPACAWRRTCAGSRVGVRRTPRRCRRSSPLASCCAGSLLGLCCANHVQVKWFWNLVFSILIGLQQHEMRMLINPNLNNVLVFSNYLMEASFFCEVMNDDRIIKGK